MAISLNDLKKSIRKDHYKMVLFGVEGIGKSCFSAMAPSPVFLDAEDGLNIDGIPILSVGSYQDVMDSMSALYTEEHDYKTLVLDSLTAFEPMLYATLCQQEGVNSIERIGGGFAKHRVESLPLWERMLKGMDALHAKGMNIILVGHSQSKEVRLPDAEAFLKYEIDLINPKAANMLYRWSDILAFANYQIAVTTDTNGSKKTGRGIGTGERIMHLEERPAYHAKNRFSLPPQMALNYEAFSTALGGSKQSTTNPVKE